MFFIIQFLYCAVIVFLAEFILDRLLFVNREGLGKEIKSTFKYYIIIISKMNTKYQKYFTLQKCIQIYIYTSNFCFGKYWMILT